MSKNISKNTIRKIILIIALFLISMAVYADSITLGNPEESTSESTDETIIRDATTFRDGTSHFTFPDASITYGSIEKFYSLTVTVTEGYIHNNSLNVSCLRNIEGLESLTFTVIKDKYTDAHKSATWFFPSDSGWTPANVQKFIRNIEFVFKHNMKIDVSVSANVTSGLPTGLTLTSEIIGGKMHYYGFVPNSGIKWTEAYTAAKNMTFEGLKGYLVTIMSAEEDAILDRITDAAGWAGAARVKDSDGPTLDQTTATSYNPASVQIGQTKWKWVCGPEKGQSIKIDGSVTLNYHQVLNGTGYSNWNVGYVNEPNSSGVSSDSSTGIGGEWVLQLHFENGKWNDLADNGSVAGYFIEFSYYDGGKADPDNYKLDGTISGTTELDSHVWSITADDTNNKFIATCTDEECYYNDHPLTLTVGIEYR
ncbi:MAG: hypothetical protein K5634_00010 [Sphaerochaetaceae bacterium]|nr:hypothetical protein [Sphaerochaetaceae bacterium]